MQAVVIACVAIAAVALPLRRRPAAAPIRTVRQTMKMPSGDMAMPQTVVCGLWRTDGDFHSRIFIKNALMVAGLAVTPTLYMTDGTPFQLAPIEIPMSGEATLDINAAIANASGSISGHVSHFGSASLTYMWDGPGHVAASMNMLDLPHSLTFTQAFVDASPSLNMLAPVAPTAGYATWRHAAMQFVPAVLRTKTIDAQTMPSPMAQADEGLWWLRDDGVRAYFSLANVSNQPIDARYQITGSGGTSLDWRQVELAPHQTREFALDSSIDSLPRIERSGGGIRVEQVSGPAQAVNVAGWLENPEEGFSANIDFATSGAMPPPNMGLPPIPQSPTVTLAAAGLMLGKPMAANHFPEKVRFAPYGHLRNTTDRWLDVSVSVDLGMAMGMAGSATSGRSLLPDLPVRLGPGMETEVPLEALADRLGRKMGIDADSTEGAMLNWSATYTGQTGELLLSTGSTDQSGNYVFEVMPQRVNSSAGEKIPYWSTADGNDTMFALWNPGSATQNVVLTLYSADGMHSYAMPIALAPMASTMVDVAMDLAMMRGTPDASGNTLPSDVQSGSAMLEPAGIPGVGPNGKILMPKTGPPEMQVVASVGIFNVTTATCGGLCMDCCYYDCAYVDASPVNVGTTISATFYVEDCCGVWWDDTSYASWSSSDPSIATSNGGGSFNTVGAGTVDLEAQILMHAQDPTNYHCIDSCGDGWVVGDFDVPVAPVITSIDAAQGLIGSSVDMEIDGNGFSGSPTVNVSGGGASASNISLLSSTAIDSTLALTTAATPNSVQISVTVNGVSSNALTFTRQIPHLEVYHDAMLPVPNGCGIPYTIRNITYNIVDQNENAVTTPIKEVFNSLSANSCANGSPSPTVCTGGGTSQFTDTLSVYCNTVGGSCGFSLQNQWQSCPSNGIAVPLGTTNWQILNSVTTLTLGSSTYSLPLSGTATPVPSGTKIFP